MLVPTANPALRGGTCADLGVDINLYATEGSFAGHRLALEVLAPVYQSLDGPQLETDWTLVVGWQQVFAQ